MFNPLLLQGLYYLAKSQRTPEVCRRCKNYRKGHDYCKKGHYVKTKNYYCSDQKIDYDDLE
jgi:hypothetical protein